MKTLKWNIVAEYISLVILAIIWVYARKGSHLPTLKNRTFQGCLVMSFCAILSNILSTTMIYHYQQIPCFLTWIVTSIYFILTPLMGLSYFLYTVSVIYHDNKELRKVMIIAFVPAVFYVVLVMINPWNHYLFSITSLGYTRGIGISSTYIIFYAYCIASIIVTLKNMKHMDKTIHRILSTFPILAVVVIIIQQIYPNVILSGSAATCALLIIYLHLQNKQISLDYLTSLPNRQELLSMLDIMLRRNPEQDFVLMVISLRNFRQINNTYGQPIGDAFLKEVSSFLNHIGPKQNVYRFNGDEFALLFTHVNEAEMKKCVEVIQKRMKHSWKVNDYRIYLSHVIGAVRHLDHLQTIEQIINAIEYAINRAKVNQEEEICYCDQKMLGQLERKNQIIQILKEKLEDESFEMYYQPIYDLKTQQFIHLESLMRLNHTPLGSLSPAEFIPIAEETGLIIEITYVIIKKVCQFINDLQKLGIEHKLIHLNFSAIQFSQPDLSEKVLQIINQYHIPLSSIEIEFTESTLAKSSQVVNEFALEMMKHGIYLGLDDFGTGYSNLTTVINIPFKTVKLDKSLVYAAMESHQSSLAIQHISSAFQELGMNIIAEGIETVEQKDMMEKFQINQIQGYYYAKPMSDKDVEKFLLSYQKNNPI